MPPAVEIALAIGATPVSRSGTALMRSASASGASADSREAARHSSPAAGRFRSAKATPPCAGMSRTTACRAAREQRPASFSAGRSGRRSMLTRRFAIRERWRRARRRNRIDGAAFDAVAGDDRFAAHGAAAERECDALERLTFEAVAEHIRPFCNEAAVCRLQRRNGHAGARQHIDPRPVRSQPRPACAAEREHGGVGLDRDALRPVLQTEAARRRPSPSSDAAA